jgi:Zn-dependent protease
MLSLPIEVLIILLPLLFFSLAFHEYFHALSAHLLGDDTAAKEGRLTVNPFAHLDLFGSIALLFIGFGWAKPVPVNPANFKHPQRDDTIVSLAGPFANFLLAGMAVVLLKTGAGSGNEIIETILWYFYRINGILAVFNLLPFFPLDGSHLVSSLLVRINREEWVFLFQKYSSYLFMVLIILDLAMNISIFSNLIGFVFVGLDKIFGFI